MSKRKRVPKLPEEDFYLPSLKSGKGHSSRNRLREWHNAARQVRRKWNKAHREFREGGDA